MAPEHAPSAQGEATQCTAQQSRTTPSFTHWQCWAWCTQGCSRPCWSAQLGCQSTLLAQIQLAANQNLKSFIAGLLSSPSSSSLYIEPGLPHPRFRINHLLFHMHMVTTLEFGKILVQGLCSLKGANTLPNLASSTNLLNVTSKSLSE